MYFRYDESEPTNEQNIAVYSDEKSNQQFQQVQPMSYEHSNTPSMPMRHDCPMFENCPMQQNCPYSNDNINTSNYNNTTGFDAMTRQYPYPAMHPGYHYGYPHNYNPYYYPHYHPYYQGYYNPYGYLPWLLGGVALGNLF